MLALNGFLLVAFIMFVNSIKADDHEKAAPPSDFAALNERYNPRYDCSMDGQWCLFDSKCCSMRCGWDFHCKNLYEDYGECAPDYGRCIESKQCCSGECYGGYICIPWGPNYRDGKSGPRALPAAGLNARSYQPAQE